MDSLGWAMFGFVGSMLFGAASLGLGLATIDPDEDYAIVILAVLVLLGFVLSAILLPLASLFVKRTQVSKPRRMGQTFAGAIAPICLVLLLVFGVQLILGG